jgi:hypothetical protein
MAKSKRYEEGGVTEGQKDGCCTKGKTRGKMV